jgi:hypothetical protein
MDRVGCQLGRSDAPHRRSSLVAEQRLLSAGEERLGFPGKPVRPGVPNRVHASAPPNQAAGGEADLDRRPADPGGEQLAPGHATALTGGDGRDPRVDPAAHLQKIARAEHANAAR